MSTSLGGSSGRSGAGRAGRSGIGPTQLSLASEFGLVWHEEVAGGFDVRADPA